MNSLTFCLERQPHGQVFEGVLKRKRKKPKSGGEKDGCMDTNPFFGKRLLRRQTHDL
jgi:hypothetical protein